MSEKFCDNPRCEFNRDVDLVEALREREANDPHRLRRRRYRENAAGPERHYCEACYEALLQGGLTPD